VHAADGYLHIATVAVEMSQMFPQAPIQYRYGRVIDPWCFDNRETMGTAKNKNFWGCALTPNGMEASEEMSLSFNNQTTVNAVTDEGYGKFTMNFTEGTGTKYAVVGPTTPSSDTDWQATSFALSSQCVPIPSTACSISLDPDAFPVQGNTDALFNCSIARGSPIDFSGSAPGYALSYTFFDFHKYIMERGTAFITNGFDLKVSDPISEIIANATDQEATEMFPSTWRWTALVTLGLSDTIPEDMIDTAWYLQSGAYMVVSCNTTGKPPLSKAPDAGYGP
jgi:hypothetical protein